MGVQDLTTSSDQSSAVESTKVSRKAPVEAKAVIEETKAVVVDFKFKMPGEKEDAERLAGLCIPGATLQLHFHGKDVRVNMPILANDNLDSMWAKVEVFLNKLLRLDLSPADLSMVKTPFHVPTTSALLNLVEGAIDPVSTLLDATVVIY